MGLDVNGIVVYGAKVIKKTIMYAKKQYNIDSGEPYLKEYFQEIWVFEATGNIYEKNEYDFDERKLFCNFGEKVGIVGLKLCTTNLRDNENEHLKLIDLSKIDDYKDFLSNEKCHLYNFLSFG